MIRIFKRDEVPDTFTGKCTHHTYQNYYQRIYWFAFAEDVRKDTTVAVVIEYDEGRKRIL